jgi:outer membrane protein OmpA-like peptidoglycan-associated protein
MDYLLKKGVPKQQLQYKGYGKRKPLVPNDWYDRDAQAKNQRVEIKILKVG